MATREARSKRDWLNAAGEKVTQPEEATAIRYRLLSGSEQGHVYDLSHLSNPMDKFAAGFGFITKAGNVANTVLNSDQGEVAEADVAIAEWIEDWQGGVYVERAAGGPGSRVNRDALAEAVFNVMTKAGKATFKDGKPVDHADIRQRLEEDTKGVLVRQWRQVDAIATEYSKLAGAPRKSVDDI